MPNLLFESAGVIVAAGAVCGSRIDPRWPGGAVALEFPALVARVFDAAGAARIVDPTVACLHVWSPGASQTPVATLPGSECLVIALEELRAPLHGDRLARLRTTRLVPVAPVIYLEHLCLVDDLRRGALTDTAQIERVVVSLAARLLSDASGATCEMSKPLSPRQRDIAMSAKKLVAVTRGERPRISAVAARLGCSVFHLCHTFRDVEGTTIGAYHQQLRLRAAARRLLETPAAPLADLALEFGFSSHSHFTAAFRKMFATTPSALTAARRVAC